MKVGGLQRARGVCPPCLAACLAAASSGTRPPTLTSVLSSAGLVTPLLLAFSRAAPLGSGSGVHWS